SGLRPAAAVKALLREAIQRARDAGISDECLVLDPGIGFFRNEAIGWHEWDAAVLGDLGELEVLGRPLCVGVSRKSFLGAIIGRPGTEERLAASLAATAVAVWNGAAPGCTPHVTRNVDALPRLGRRPPAGGTP